MTENPHQLLLEANQRVERLRFALGLALELQASVESFRPGGYGSPMNTIEWMDAAKRAMDDTDVQYA